MDLPFVKRLVAGLAGWLFTLSIVGQVANLPVVHIQGRDYYQYEVKKSETLFSLCRRFQVTEEILRTANPSLVDGLKAGQLLLIPAKTTNNDPQANEAEDTPQSVHRTAVPETSKHKRELARITLLLPFNQTETSALNERYVEFYEGFLLAVDTLKSMGFSFEVQALNVGSDAGSIEQLILEGALDQTDYCVGGINAVQISTLSHWAASTQKTAILPFSSRIPEMIGNNFLYQPLTTQEHMLSRLASYMSIRFAGTNYILLKDPTHSSSSKNESLTEALKTQFAKTGSRYREVYPDETLDSLVNSLSDIYESVIVPFPMSLNEASRFVTTLAAAAAKKPQKNITLFGYPEWQAMNKRTIQLFHTLNTHVFSSFYANFQEEAVRDFQLTYNATFGKALLNTFPKYGIMGYDIASHFIPKMVSAHEGHAVKEGPDPLQHAFLFRPTTSGSGSYNQLFYLVNFSRDNDVEVKEIR